MKILFIRHGESSDDVQDRYGGWADFALTDKGTSQIFHQVANIQALGINFERIFTSPLTRALQSAKVLATEIRAPYEIFEYVKERNTYGVLSGMRKDDAKQKYVEQVANLDNDEYVDGSERYKDLSKRVKKSVALINQSGYANVIVVTHGNYLKCLFSEVLGKRLTKKEDGGWGLLDFSSVPPHILKSNGIAYE